MTLVGKVSNQDGLIHSLTNRSKSSKFKDKDLKEIYEKNPTEKSQEVMKAYHSSSYDLKKTQSLGYLQKEPNTA
jgi:hypothetical protein